MKRCGSVERKRERWRTQAYHFAKMRGGSFLAPPLCLVRRSIRQADLDEIVVKDGSVAKISLAL
jgi:hypothetical protein